MYLTPMTRERSVAAEWLERFEGAGLDGVVAKPAEATYEPGKRAMLKISTPAPPTASSLDSGGTKRFPTQSAPCLGLYDDRGTLHHVGVTSFTVAARKALVAELEPLRKNAPRIAPVAIGATPEGGGQRMPGGQSRWSAGKDLSWEPLRIERVCEVATTICRATAFVMRRRSAGGQTSHRPTAATTNSR